MRYWVVMPAAGGGQRFGGAIPKQYLPLAGRAVIEWSLQPFLVDARCLGICIALAPGDTQFATLPVAGNALVETVTGGSQRADSVLAALEHIAAAEGDWVMVHDAARPCVSGDEIERLIAAVQHGDGALLAVPVADTLKSAGIGERVTSTVPRQALWRAQTPQLFRVGPLRAALRSARTQGRVPTDEAQSLEWVGGSPLLARGSALNVKVTEPSDLLLAEAILSLREGQR